MTVALRAHHLLCVLTYVGKGYSAAFVHNYDAIAARLAAGEEVLVVDRPDDICAPLSIEAKAHCWGARVAKRDQRAARDLETLVGLPIVAGTRFALDPELVTRLRDAFARGVIRGACVECEWSDLCTDVARSQYHGTCL